MEIVFCQRDLQCPESSIHSLSLKTRQSPRSPAPQIEPVVTSSRHLSFESSGVKRTGASVHISPCDRPPGPQACDPLHTRRTERCLFIGLHPRGDAGRLTQESAQHSPLGLASITTLSKAASERGEQSPPGFDSWQVKAGCADS